MDQSVSEQTPLGVVPENVANPITEAEALYSLLGPVTTHGVRSVDYLKGEKREFVTMPEGLKAIVKVSV